MSLLRRFSLAFALTLLVPAGTAVASSGGAGLVSPGTTRGIVTTKGVNSVFTRTLRKGQRGVDVRTLQSWLTEVGFAVPQTGYFGTMTKSAVRGFQISHALLPASGAVGHRTASSLQSAVQTAAKSISVATGTGASTAAGLVFPLKPLSNVLAPKAWTLDQGIDI